MKLGRFWARAWTWDQSMGVGLRLSGKPNNEQQFLQFLYEQNCNPIAAHRVLKELKENGFKLTTVHSTFNFVRMGEDFAKLGVTMDIIAPINKLAQTKLDQVALLLCLGKDFGGDYGDLNPEEVTEAMRRAARTGVLNPKDIGQYASVLDQED